MEGEKRKEKMEEIVDCLWERGVIVLSGKGYSKKHYLTKELAKKGINPTHIFGKSLKTTNLYSTLPELLKIYSSQ